MNKLPTLLFCTLATGILLSGCNKEPNTIPQGNKHRVVEEAVTGMVVEQTEVGSFLQLVNNSGVPIVVIPDSSYNVVVQADDVATLSSITTDVTSGTLTVNAPADISSTEATVFVYAPPVTMVTLGKNGSVEMQGTYSLLNVFMNGTGNLTLNGQAQSLQISGSGSGHVNALNLSAGSVAVSTKGAAVAKVAPLNSLNVNLNGNAKVFYTGNPAISKTLKGNSSLQKI
jgi:hypothetical protein